MTTTIALDPRRAAVRAGLSRGWIETRQNLTETIMIVSGIFYPITVLPTWLQWVAQVFPVYWVGLGARSAMLPAEMVEAEIGQSWRTVEMFAVLSVWAVIGFLLAPILLRRMARRQSGSAVAKVRERYMSKGY